MNIVWNAFDGRYADSPRALHERIPAPRKYPAEDLDLHAAEHVDRVDTGHDGGVDDGRARATVPARRGAGDDRPDTGHLGDVDSHERAGGERERAGRQVRPDAPDRHVAVPDRQPRQQLDLDIGEVRSLLGRELPGALRAELDRRAQRRGQRVPTRTQLLVGERLQVAVPAVQLGGVVQDSVAATLRISCSMRVTVAATAGSSWEAPRRHRAA